MIYAADESYLSVDDDDGLKLCSRTTEGNTLLLLAHLSSVDLSVAVAVVLRQYQQNAL
jgi:hypothetical protein